MFRQHVYRSSVVVAIALITAAAVVTSSDLGAQRQRFFSDDPLLRDPETQDASKVEAWDIGLTPDLLLNLFSKPGDRASNVRAQNVNTADEVPDSGWFTNRVYATPLTTDDVTRGPLTTDGPAPGKWIVVGGKAAGVAPGFTARDEKGVVWFVSFDGRDNPVAPTAAIAVATRLFWALGYFQVENHLTTLRPENVVVDSSATMRAHGKRRQMTKKDIDQVFDRSARSADGSYRAIAGRALPGRPVGGFKYYGTRPDDPNDVVPHEHRRELRALQVFGAWANLVDMKAGNTLDTVITENGRGVVRHYLQDVGSTFGTGALAARDGDEGYEYLYEGEMLSKRLLTFGFFLSPWQTVDYDEHPEIGRFEGDDFEPEDWKPRVPVAALRQIRPDDALWAALRVMAFTDDLIRAAAKTGNFTDPAAEKLLADILIKRRNKIGRVYYSRINPLVRFELTDTGLAFENPAVKAGLSEAPKQGYHATWYRFNNGTGAADQIGSPTTTSQEQLQAPADLPRDANSYVKVSVRAVEPPHAPWATPADVYFRRDGNAWRLVGVERVVN